MALKNQDMSLIQLEFKWQDIKFLCLISKKIILNNLNLNFGLNETNDFNIQLVAYSLAKEVLEYFNLIYRGIKLEDVTIKFDEELDFDSFKSTGFNNIHLKIKNLFGHTIGIKAETDLELDKLLNHLIIKENKLFLPQVSPLQGTYDFMIHNKSFSLKAVEKIYISKKKLNFLKIEILINDQISSLMISKNFIRHITFLRMGEISNFSYNDYFTTAALDLVVAMISNKYSLNVTLLKYSYIVLPLDRKYIVLNLIGDLFSGAIMISNKGEEILLQLLQKLLVVKSSIPGENLMNLAESKLSLSVYSSKINISMAELTNLDINDIIVLDQDKNTQKVYIDLGHSSLKAEIVEDEKVVIKGRI